MRNGLYLMTGAALSILLVSGCARQTIVLLPDPDGHTGKVEVVTAGGRQLLEKPNEMTTVSGPGASPSPVVTADPLYISATFGEALAVEPLPSEKFILFFETGTTKLTLESRATVTALLDAINRRGAITIAVSGHADASGSVQINDKLAFDRAEMVRAMLLQNGVSTERVAVSSHGKGNPLVPTPEGVAEPRNRRVEVIIR